MRTLALAALTMVTAFSAGTAEAQRLGAYPGASYPVPTMQGGPSYPGPQPQQLARPVQQRWIRDASGRWYGGTNAPGGWNAYRRPSRGHRLSRYWISDSFFIGDYVAFGLSAPPPGYNWHRYYDDAVLIDSRGRVYDWVNGVNWDGGYGGAGGYAQSYGGGGYAYAEGGAGATGYAQQSYQQQRYAPLPPVSQNGAVTTYSTSSGYAQNGYAQGEYAQGGYTAAPGTTTVITIPGAPTVTTTTTEYIEETRTRYVAPRRVYRAPVRRYYRPVRTCGCRVAPRIVRRVVRPVEQPVQGS